MAAFACICNCCDNKNHMIFELGGRKDDLPILW